MHPLHERMIASPLPKHHTKRKSNLHPRAFPSVGPLNRFSNTFAATYSLCPFYWKHECSTGVKWRGAQYRRWRNTQLLLGILIKDLYNTWYAKQKIFFTFRGTAFLDIFHDWELSCMHFRLGIVFFCSLGIGAMAVWSRSKAWAEGMVG